MERPHLYLITDRHRTAGRPLLEVVERALQGGVDAVQLREKDLAADELLLLAMQLRSLCSAYGAHLLINDRIDIALAAGADGVHLPATSFSAADARQLLGPHALIGASTHTIEQAHAAHARGADFIVFGPLFDTPAKRTYGAQVGLDALAAVTHAVSLPVLGIGGIDSERAAGVRQRGAQGVAVISAILAALDPRSAAAALRASVR